LPNAANINVPGTAQGYLNPHWANIHGLTQQNYSQQMQTQQSIYWCVDRCWSEPSCTERKILDVSQLAGDPDLFQQLATCYKGIRGLIGRFFSWKSCMDIAFIEVSHHVMEHLAGMLLI
jgi:hypothetical protein